MEEIGPLIIGIGLAVFASLVGVGLMRGVGIPLACVAAGFAWSHWTGELSRHWGYGALDATQVVLAYVVARWLAVHSLVGRIERRID
jgi:hypothetical protein